MEYQRPPSAVALSRKLANGHGVARKHVYDGVFAGPVKLGSRVEDYKEIFGGSGNSSIPILEVPELNESKIFVDARGSTLDYSKIFGGFGDADFAVPHGQLIAKSKKGKVSSQEARNTSEARSRAEVLEHPSFSEQKQVPPQEASVLSFDGLKQLNSLNHKTSTVSENGTNGTTNFAQLHPIPAHTRKDDEFIPSQKAEGGKPACSKSMLNDGHLNVNVSGGIKESKTYRRVVSGPQPAVASSNTFTSHAEFLKSSGRNRSMSNDMSFDGFEIGLGRHQSRTPPPLSQSPNIFSNKGTSNGAINSKFGVTSRNIPEGPVGNDSPPLFDEEVDANSAAAVSAAAVRKAIEEAQAKLKIAKELMERKREGLQNHVKLRYGDGLKAYKREVKTVEKSNGSKEAEVQKVCERNSPSLVFSSLSEDNETKRSHVAPDFRDGHKYLIPETTVGQTNSMGRKQTQAEEVEHMKAAKYFSEPPGTQEHSAATLVFEQADNVRKMTASACENEWMEITIEKESTKTPEEGGKTLKSFDVLKRETFDDKPNFVEEAFGTNIYTNRMNSTQELQLQEEKRENKTIAHDHEEADQTPELSFEQGKCESEGKKLQELEKNAKPESWELGENEDMKVEEEAQDCVVMEKKESEAHNQEEMENRSDEVPVKEENEQGLNDVPWQKENGKEREESSERVECEKRHEEAWTVEENEKKQSDAHGVEDIEKNSAEFLEQEVTKMKFSDLQDQEESNRMPREDGGAKESSKLEETKENEKIIFEEEYQMNEAEKRQENSCEWVQNGRINEGMCGKQEDEDNVEMTRQAFSYHAKNLETADGVCKQDKNECLGMINEDRGYDEKSEAVETDSVELQVEENGRTMEVSEVGFELKEAVEESKAVEGANDLQEDENVVAANLAQGVPGPDGIKKQLTDITESFVIGRVYLGETDLNLEHVQTKDHETEYKSVCDEVKYFEELACELDENDQDANESEVGTDNNERENASTSSVGERWLGNGIELSDLEKHVDDVACELRENDSVVKGSEDATNHEEENSSESSHDERWVNTGIDMESSQQPCTSEGEETTMEMSREEKMGQQTDKKEDSYHSTLTVEEGEVEDTLQKELDMKKRQHRKKEEAKEREIEKEKQRIAVERAIREARERAFALARERAALERASSEAHPKTRERLEKAPAVADDKSVAEKASMEAKLKAERAAVERATAEARVRALEKALSKKAEKFAAEKFSGASADDRTKSSAGVSTDQQYSGSGPPTSSRYSGPSSAEKFNGANSESTQKCKATSERDQRTAERAAKALAEKNMRDILAQREQAERNRLAETLDADVKRWSSGKERNLRALLSTLQYILGPDSGWQPIPLTDLISTAAVKKAYRKAALVVHPDKLQQRGASIQQKYTCEKVFDLLKEAWNKFSAEER